MCQPQPHVNPFMKQKPVSMMQLLGAKPAVPCPCALCELKRDRPKPQLYASIDYANILNAQFYQNAAYQQRALANYLPGGSAGVFPNAIGYRP